MSTTSVRMFGEIEVTTNRALAYAILVSQAAHAYMAAIRRSHELANALEALVKVLTAENLSRLTVDQKKWLTPRLQEIHSHLVTFSRSRGAAAVCHAPVLGGFVSRIQDGTEDLCDVIEDLVLVDDADFRNLIAACERTITASESEPIARLQGQR
jgi:hypothetical protein